MDQAGLGTAGDSFLDTAAESDTVAVVEDDHVEEVVADFDIVEQAPVESGTEIEEEDLEKLNIVEEAFDLVDDTAEEVPFDEPPAGDSCPADSDTADEIFPDMAWTFPADSDSAAEPLPADAAAESLADFDNVVVEVFPDDFETAVEPNLARLSQVVDIAAAAELLPPEPVHSPPPSSRPPRFPPPSSPSPSGPPYPSPAAEYCSP